MIDTATRTPDSRPLSTIIVTALVAAVLIWQQTGLPALKKLQDSPTGGGAGCMWRSWYNPGSWISAACNSKNVLQCGADPLTCIFFDSECLRRIDGLEAVEVYMSTVTRYCHRHEYMYAHAITPHLTLLL